MTGGISRRGYRSAWVLAQRPCRPSALTSDRATASALHLVGLGNSCSVSWVPRSATAATHDLPGLVSGHADKANRIASEQNLPASSVYSYADFDRIAADPAIKVVYIVLPNFMHAEYTIRAPKAGKHVLCEKPMASTVADAEAMVAAAKAANRKLMIAYRCHYEPLNVEAMRRVRSGELGKSRLAITKMVRQSNLNDPSDAWRLRLDASPAVARSPTWASTGSMAPATCSTKNRSKPATAGTNVVTHASRPSKTFYSLEFSSRPVDRSRAPPPSMPSDAWLTRSMVSTSASSPIPAGSTAESSQPRARRHSVGNPDRRDRPVRARDGLDGRCCARQSASFLLAKRAFKTCG